MLPKVAELKVRITGTADMLGGSPLNKEIYSKYMVAKTDTEEEKAQAEKEVDEIRDAEDNILTGFYRDADGYPVLKGYQIKGFLKAAATSMKDDLGLAMPASKIDNYVFIKERNIPLYRENGDRIKDVDSILERPLRAETMRGPRVSIARSEVINEGFVCDVTIQVLNNKGTAKSKPIDLDMIKTMLWYGKRKGLLQWRNAGYGTFDYEVIEEGEAED